MRKAGKMAEQKDLSSPLLKKKNKNTKITTNCGTTINKKMLDLPKKIPFIQRQRSHNETVGGVQSQ